MDENSTNHLLASQVVENIKSSWNKIASNCNSIDEVYQGKCANDLKNKIVENEKIVNSIIQKIEKLNNMINSSINVITDEKEI